MDSTRGSDGLVPSCGAILSELEGLADARTRATLLRHGAAEPCLGVRIGELQRIRRRVGRRYELALELYETGVHDARYLAGLVTDDSRMTPEDLNGWVASGSELLAGSIVSGVAAGSPCGVEVADEWVDSKETKTAVAGWATWSGIVSVHRDEDLDLRHLEELLRRVCTTIHGSPNAVRYPMNGFVIAVGCFVRPLLAVALEIAEAIGPVEVDMGDTACRVPRAADYIRKVEGMGRIGRKRPRAKC